VLKTMQRGKGADQLIELIDAMKSKPNSFVRSTFIVGHPGETQEDFELLCDYVQKYRFDRVNIFSYSDEDGTDAYLLENKIDQEIIDNRAEILGDMVTKITQEKLEEDLYKEFDIVVDGQSSEHEYLLSARKISWATDIDGEIYINDNELSEPIKYGKIYKCKITDISGDKLLATIVR
jgi:tRNA A37 methylthiotransferase MiaB